MKRSLLKAVGQDTRPRELERRREDAENASCDTRSPTRTKKHEDYFSIKTTPAYWDNLSKIWLTKRALRELDRRQAHNNPRITKPVSIPRRPRPNLIVDAELLRFARHGGPALDDLRAYPESLSVPLVPAMSSKAFSRSRQTRSMGPTSYTSPSTARTKTSAYDIGFEQHLIDNGIFPDEYEYEDGQTDFKPNNFETIQQRLRQPRSSLSPSTFESSTFLEFTKQNARIVSESRFMSTLMPVIHGRHYEIPNEEDILFTNLESMTNNTMVKPKPNFYDGAHQSQLEARVRQDLNTLIIPTKRDGAPVLPNFFAEVKARSGGPDVVRRQACYDGAIGARAMHQLQSYGEEEPIYDNNAYTISTTYQDGLLRMYTTHPTAGTGGSTQHHMTQLRALALDDTPESFRQGAIAFRNGRDWATKQRDNFITKANTAAKHCGTAVASNFAGGKYGGYRSAESSGDGSRYIHQSKARAATEDSDDEYEGEDELDTSVNYALRTATKPAKLTGTASSLYFYPATASPTKRSTARSHEQYEEEYDKDENDRYEDEAVEDDVYYAREVPLAATNRRAHPSQYSNTVPTSLIAKNKGNSRKEDDGIEDSERYKEYRHAPRAQSSFPYTYAKTTSASGFQHPIPEDSGSADELALDDANIAAGKKRARPDGKYNRGQEETRRKASANGKGGKSRDHEGGMEEKRKKKKNDRRV